RLERIREDRRPLGAARTKLAASEHELRVDADVPREIGERRLVVERGAGTAQVALVAVRAQRVQTPCDREVEEGVAEKFETLVVVLRRATVRQRQLQQQRIFEAMVQVRLGPAGPGVHRLISTCLSNVTRNQISARKGVRLSYSIRS